MAAATSLMGILGVQCTDKPIQQPNVVLILADDMGYSDIGCYGGEISTPNIDALAEKGVRFSQFYNTARSCPSRASLMTGLHPAQTGVGHMTHLVYQGEPYQGYLRDNCVTIPEVLSTAGYSTWMSGKWHAGNAEGAIPEDRGFQHCFSIHHWCDSYFRVLETSEIYEDGQMSIPAFGKDQLKYQEDGRVWYTTDIFTDKALEYIDRSQEGGEAGKPFFLYAAYNAPHWPLEAHDEIVNKYIGKYDMGYVELIKQKTERMKEMGILSPDQEIGWQDMVKWEGLSDDDKANTAFRRAIYAAQVEILDQNVGRIVAKLKEKGIYDNTIIIFLSDNGCSAEPEFNNFGYWWKDHRISNYDEWKFNSERQGASQGKMWAIASNAPFRMYKKFIHEGGISTPLIISWPSQMKAAGNIVHTPCYLPDVMATLADAAGAEYPKTFKGHDITPCQGRSFLPAVYGKKVSTHDVMYWEHEGHGAIRMGHWKLVTTDIKDGASWELYNIASDRAENHDLAAKEPERAAKMYEKWLNWANETGVLPQEKIKK